jgi:hypothetical protein
VSEEPQHRFTIAQVAEAAQTSASTVQRKIRRVEGVRTFPTSGGPGGSKPSIEYHGTLEQLAEAVVSLPRKERSRHLPVPIYLRGPWPEWIRPALKEEG